MPGPVWRAASDQGVQRRPSGFPSKQISRFASKSVGNLARIQEYISGTRQFLERGRFDSSDWVGTAQNSVGVIVGRIPYHLDGRFRRLICGIVPSKLASGIGSSFVKLG